MNDDVKQAKEIEAAEAAQANAPAGVPAAEGSTPVPPAEAGQTPPADGDLNPEFEALAEALAAGEDINEQLPATAAGEGGGASGDAIGSGVRFDRIDSRANPNAGIDPDFTPPPLIDPTADTEILVDENGFPSAGENDSVQLDDDALDGGNPGGIGDVDPDTANTSGTLAHNFGPDGAGSISWLTSGAPAGFTYELSGDDLLIKQGGTTVIMVELNPLTGEYTVIHNAPVDHAPGGNENDVNFTLTYAVTDSNGDSAQGSLLIGVDDDTPEFIVSEYPQESDFEFVVEPTLTVDETELGTDDSASFAAAFGSVSYGADGSADTDPLVYSLAVSVDGVDSGMVDTLSGEKVFLYLNGDVVEGRTETGDDLVFTVSVDELGVVTLDQLRAVVHDNPADHDESSEPTTLSSDDLITLTATATDGDGDLISETINIGSNLAFEDDGPSIGLAGSSIDLTVDETDLATDATDDVASLFTGLDAGADGQKTLSYSLGISASGADSGVVDTATGNSVYLFLESGVVVGREGTDALDAATGDIVFTVTLTGSSIELDQLRAVVHDDPADHDESTSPAVLSAADLVTVTATLTDGDDDVASQTANIGGALAFEDDGPSTIAPESGFLLNKLNQSLTGLALDVDTNIDDNMGADQGGTLTFAEVNGSDSGYTSGQQTIYLYVSSDGLTLVGSTTVPDGILDAGDDAVTDNAVFTAVLNPDGSLGTSDDTYDFTLHKQIDGGLTQFKVTDTGFVFHGGNDPYAYFEDTNPLDANGEQDILLTPIGGETMNTNANEGGVGSGNSVGTGEGVRVDYVYGIAGDPAKDPGSTGGYTNPLNQDHTFTGHNTVNGASALFTAISGATGTSVIGVTAWDDSDGNVAVGDGTQDDITSVIIIYNGQEKTVFEGDTNTYDVGTPADHITISVDWDHSGELGAAISGVESDTEIVVFTADGLTTVEWTHEGGETFKIGGFGASVPEPGELIQLDFDLQLEDGDGDTVLIEDGLVLNLSPEDHIIQEGTLGGDFLTAATPGQAETLVGLGGDDTLVGNDGADILVGGSGIDTMTGNGGADTFLWLAGDEAGAPTDTIMDFNVAQGDVLHLSALLTGESNDAATLDAYLNFSLDSGNTVIQIDADGAGGATDQTIVLEGVDLVTGAASDQAIIQSLLDTSSLVTD